MSIHCCEAVMTLRLQELAYGLYGTCVAVVRDTILRWAALKVLTTPRPDTDRLLPEGVAER